jgi:hypothetical protein
MKIVNDDTALRIVDSTRAIAYGALAGLIYCVGDLLSVMTYRAPEHNETLGMSLGAFICLVGGCAFFRKGDFVFDKYARKLVWRRGGLFGQSGGEVPFAEIREVVVESKRISSGDGNVPAYRIVLRLPGAPEAEPVMPPAEGPHFSFRATWGTPQGVLPVSESYRAGAQKHCEEIAARIREVLCDRKA